MLKVYLSPQAHLLAQALLPVLHVTAPADPLQLQAITVGNPDSGRWLKQYLAQHLPICAGIETPLLSRAIWSLGNQAAGLPETPDPLGESELSWALFKHLPSWLETDLPELDHAYQSRLDTLNDAEAALWLLARELGGLFDRYLVYRPDWILEWQSPGEHHWQGQLWGRLYQALGQPDHRAARWAMVTQALADFHSETPLVVFNPGPVPRPMLEQIAAFAQHNTVVWFQFSPSTDYFGDLQTPRQASRQNQLAELPFVGSMVSGLKAQLDFLSEHGEIAPLEIPSTPETALQQLQHSITQLTLPEPIKPDASLTLACAPGAVREVEELKEWLVPRLEQADLNPRDVLVLTPDVERYGPLMKAIFEEGETGFIPVAVLDRTQGDADPAMAALLGLLSLLDDVGCDATLDWLSLEPVAAHYQLAPSDLDQIREWALQGGWIRGLDPDTPNHSPQRHHFQGMLDRLMFSWVMEQHPPGWAIDTPLKTSQSDTLNKLCRVFQDLADLAAQLDQDATPAQWWQRLTPIAAGWLAPDNALAQWVEDTQSLDFDQPISLSVLRSYARESAQRNAQNARFAAGRLNLCTPLPARGLPFKIICLLGFEAGAFPRPARRSDLDLIAQHPRAGDRQVNQEDRALFLESLLNAQQAIYLSFSGIEPSDGSEVPPCVPLGLLLQHLQCEIPTPAPINTASVQMRQRHRLIDARRQHRSAPKPAQYPPLDTLPISPDALRQAITEPFQYYLEHTLDTRLRALEPRDDLMPMGISEERVGLWVSGELHQQRDIRWLDTAMAAAGAGGEISAEHIDDRLRTLKAWQQRLPKPSYLRLDWCGYRASIENAHQGYAITLAAGVKPSPRVASVSLLRHLWLCGQGIEVTSMAVGSEQTLRWDPIIPENARRYFEQWKIQFWQNQQELAQVSLGWFAATKLKKGEPSVVKSNVSPMAFADRLGATLTSDNDLIMDTLALLGPWPTPIETPDPEVLLGTS